MILKAHKNPYSSRLKQNKSSTVFKVCILYASYHSLYAYHKHNRKSEIEIFITKKLKKLKAYFN